MINQSFTDPQITIILLQGIVIPMIITLLYKKLNWENHQEIILYLKGQRLISFFAGAIISLLSLAMLKMFPAKIFIYDILSVNAYAICFIQLLLLGKKWEGYAFKKSVRKASLVKKGIKENISNGDWIILGISFVICLFSLVIYVYYSVSLSIVPFHVKEFLRLLVMIGIIVVFLYRGDTYDKAMCKVVFYSMSFLLLLLSYGYLKTCFFQDLSITVSGGLNILPLMLGACFAIFILLRFRKV